MEMGSVTHARPASPWAWMVIASAPWFLNSALGFGLGWVFREHVTGWLLLPATWLAVSIATHAFPSLEDAVGLLESLWKEDPGWTARLVGTPLGAVMVVGQSLTIGRGAPPEPGTRPVAARAPRSVSAVPSGAHGSRCQTAQRSGAKGVGAGDGSCRQSLPVGQEGGEASPLPRPGHSGLHASRVAPRLISSRKGRVSR
jgi:hypothetical protein